MTLDAEQIRNWDASPQSLTEAAQRAIHDYGQDGDAEKAMQRLCAAYAAQKEATR